jgi:signal transduction histidine kinase
VRRNQTELRTSYERISDLGRRLLVAQEAERSRIARELHDDISQQMALLAMDLEVLNGTEWVRKGDGENLARGALERAQGISRTVHDLSHRLHPEKLRLLGLVAALQSLQREWAHNRLTVTFSHEHVPDVLSHDLTLCLFRIVQEALQNVARHSGAHGVTIHLKGVPPMLTLTVVDNGRGFDVAAAWGKGLGLISMSERLESLGGRLTIRSTRGAGTALTVTVPMAAAAWSASPASALRAIK